jgi:hypothetical protein
MKYKFPIQMLLLLVKKLCGTRCIDLAVVSPDSMVKVSDPEKHPGILNDDDGTEHANTQIGIRIVVAFKIKAKGCNRRREETRE